MLYRIILYYFQVKSGWNTDKSQPSVIDNQINVKVNSVSNNNGNFACKFSLDEEMTFKTPGNFWLKSNVEMKPKINLSMLS